ncbi:hypothetical protein DPEC_G00007320 [Dallia pectoralis]|uniref:Uncharacterized protein n=1 Tax=Dallia pectoralis TaxID=75939 RepID=A0ACC2HKB6_DALPE|nr:hypothetical protein DPEC_G00007320 [Dallia pectoralis]
MCNVDILQNFEIYIPKKAEVKTTPIETLPNSMLTRMGVPCSPGNRVTRRSALLATWISPVVIRERGCSQDSPTENGTKNNLASLVNLESQDAMDPLLIPFISSSYTAFNVLSEFLPSKQNLRRETRTVDTPLPQGHPPIPRQDTIIIHHGRIFLSIKKTKTVGGKRKHNPDQKKSLPPKEPPRSPEAEQVVLSPARKRPIELQVKKEEQQRFGKTRKVQTRSSISSPGDLEPQQAAEQCPSTEEALNTKHNQLVRKLFPANRLKIPGRCLEQKEFITQEHKSPVNSNTSCKRPSIDFSCRGGISSEANDDQEKDRDEEVGHNLRSVKRHQVKKDNKSKIGKEAGAATSGEEPGVGDNPSDVLNDTSIPAEAVNPDKSPGIQVVAPDYVTRECDKMAECPVTPTHSSTQIQYHGFDFEQSAREERINRIRAKLRDREAALNNLRS